MFVGISPLLILVYLCFFFLHFQSFTFASNFPAPYSCFPVDTNPVSYHCFDNNLPIQNPAFSLPHSPSYSPPRPRKWGSTFGRVNTIATLLIVLITILNVIVYKLRQIQELNSGEKLTVSSSLLSEQLCRRFSLSEIVSATHNFDESLVIGQGGFGKVYKGVVDSGVSTVAVKRLNPLSKQGASEFWTEISMLSKYRHSHLVSLLGYCDNYSEMILVYDYMVHGTLADHLHKIVKTGATNTPLCWVQRLNICIGAARGLDYLHTGTGIRHRVIHRDVKSTNILLDENWAAKISDFGMSKIGPANQSCTHISTHVKGTFGYVDPEYFLTRRLTRKSDVYSFGVVLLEVLCGRPAVDSRLHEDQRGLARWAQYCIKEGKVDQIVDRTIRGEIQSNCLSAFVQIADQCLDILPKKRPTMAEVVAWLEFALSLQQKRDSSIFEEGYFNTFTVSESQENGGSSTNGEILSDANEHDGITVLGDGNGVESPTKPTVNGANRSESPMKLISVDDRNGNQSPTNRAKRMTFAKKVQLLFVKPRWMLPEKIKGIGTCYRKTKNDLPSTTNSSSQVRSDLKPSSDRKSSSDQKPSSDRKGKNNLGGTSQLLNKNEDMVQLVPPSRYLVTPNTVKDARAAKAQKRSKNSGENNTLANKDGVGVSQVPASEEILASPKLKIFTYAELKIATRNFRPDSLLGEGGFGKVFKGWVDEKTYAPTKLGFGMPIAVKKFNPEGFQGFKEWQSEVEFLGRYIHPNLVKLLGYGYEDKEALIVYEYMPKGSLDRHIFTRGVEPLSWATRLKIATGAARGLTFLHTSDKKLIYRDFKSPNILLDADFNPKLSDFGLAKLAPGEGNSHVTTQVFGTHGYAAPEYLATGHLYVKSDVYGFGVVLLEMLTGLRALDVNRPTGEHNLVDFAGPFLRNRRKLKSFVDPRLELNYPPKGAFRLAALVLHCLKADHQARPPMTEVVEILEQIQQLTEGKILQVCEPQN